MKRKIKCICIDGTEKSGKTSIAREICRFFEEKDLELLKIKGFNDKTIQQHADFLDYTQNKLVIKEKGLLSQYAKDVKEEGAGPQALENRYRNLILKERDLNIKHGTVNFFLLPEQNSLDRIYNGEVPEYVNGMISFFKGINLWSFSQGLDIRLIPINEFDRIYDVRDKVLKIIEKEYEI